MTTHYNKKISIANVFSQRKMMMSHNCVICQEIKKFLKLCWKMAVIESIEYSEWWTYLNRHTMTSSHGGHLVKTYTLISIIEVFYKWMAYQINVIRICFFNNIHQLPVLYMKWIHWTISINKFDSYAHILLMFKTSQKQLAHIPKKKQIP